MKQKNGASTRWLLIQSHFFITITIFKSIGTEHSLSRRTLSYFSLNKAYCWIFFATSKVYIFYIIFFSIIFFRLLKWYQNGFFMLLGHDLMFLITKIKSRTHFLHCRMYSYFYWKKRIEKETNEPKKCPIGQ